jgi:hypothetical protein
MANNCSNYITIEGESENLKKLHQRINEVVPKLGQSLNLGNYGDLFDTAPGEGYEYSSKWQTIYELDLSDDMLIIEGDSAWWPADGLWKAISKEYSLTIEVKYEEPGEDFAGRVTFEGGEETYREETTYMEHIYKEERDYFWEEIANKSEWTCFEDLVSDLGDFYETLPEKDKERIKEVHSENYDEDEDE